MGKHRTTDAASTPSRRTNKPPSPAHIGSSVSGTDEVVKYLKALIALQCEQQVGQEDDKKAKPELVLARAGLSSREIAELAGKSQAAVQKSISRAKAASKKASEGKAQQSNE